MKKAGLIFLCLAPLAPAQFYNITTVAGVGRLQFVPAGSAVNARLIQPKGVAVDAAGNTYISDGYYQQVFRVTPAGAITVYAGNGLPGFSGDGGPATQARLFNPQAIVADSAGNLYICDYGNGRVRKVTPDGKISTAIALAGAYGIDVDSAGNLYVSQYSANMIQKVSPQGTATIIAGTGQPGDTGDGGSALAATIYGPEGLTLDTAGNVYFADFFNHRIRKVTSQGIISTVAGDGNGAFRGDGGLATSASLFYPGDVTFDANGNMYIADATNDRIRMVNTSGIISTFGGGGNSLTTQSALGATLSVPIAIATDNQGNLVVACLYLRQVRQITPQKIMTTLAGALPTAGLGDNLPATTTALLDPVAVVSDSAGNLVIADQVDNRVRKVSTQGIITTVAGNGLFGSTGNGGLAVNAQIGSPHALGQDPFGNLYVASKIGAVVRKIAQNGIISAFAGGGGIGSGGDGGAATSAQLNLPGATIGDTQGNVYISDDGSSRIRRVNPSGFINTIAGTGAAGFSGDNGPATLAQLYRPQQMAFDNKGNLFIADESNNRIRKLATDGTITTVAGNGSGTFAGDGGPATAAGLPSPDGLAIDAPGNLYITSGARVRKVDAATGMIMTIAGNGGSGFSGDGGLATLATLSTPVYLAIDGAGNVYVTDEDNQRVRQLTPVQIVKEGVVNGGTGIAGGVAPGEIVTVYIGPGLTLGPAQGAGLQLDPSGLVASLIAGVRVLFDGVAAPITFVNAGQVNCVVPYEVAGKATTHLQIIIQGKGTNTIEVPVVPSSPGVFAITNSDGGVNSSGNPSDAEGTLVIFATGEGKTDPAVATGSVNSTVFPKPLLPVVVLINGQEAFVAYAGAAPGFVAGVLQINVQIPPGVHGTVPLQIKIGDATTPDGLMITVR